MSTTTELSPELTFARALAASRVSASPAADLSLLFAPSPHAGTTAGVASLLPAHVVSSRPPSSSPRLDSSPSFLPDGVPVQASRGPSLGRRPPRKGIFPVPDLASSMLAVQSPASLLAEDMSVNLQVDPRQATPRRALFAVNTNVNLPRRCRTFGGQVTSFTDSHLDTGRVPVFGPSENVLFPHKAAAVSFVANATSATSAISNGTGTGTTTVLPQKSSSSLMAPPRGHRGKSLSNAGLLLRAKPCLQVADTGLRTESPNKKPRSTLFSPSFDPSPLHQVDSDNDVVMDSPQQSRPSKFRRTQSMFQHAEDVMMHLPEIHTPINETAAAAVNDDLGPPPTYFSTPPATNRALGFESFTVKEDPFRRIESSTLCDILDGRFNHLYNKKVVIDCRFEYEFQGGHIDGAVNINDKDLLERALLDNDKLAEYSAENHNRTLLIFHCEYSAHRGPRMAMHLRNCDRQLNMNRYPQLHYPDIVILHGGYSHFFQHFYTRCMPQRYVEMNDSSHIHTCEREMDKFRRSMKLMRSSTAPVGFGAARAARSLSCVNLTFEFPKRTPLESSKESPDLGPSDTPTTRRPETVPQRLFV